MPPAKSLAIPVLAILILICPGFTTTWAEDEQPISIIVLKNGETIQAGRAWINDLGRVCFMKDGAVLSKAAEDVDLEASRLVAPEKKSDANMSLAHLQAARIPAGPPSGTGSHEHSDAAGGGYKTTSASNLTEAQRQLVEKEKSRLRQEIAELKEKLKQASQGSPSSSSSPSPSSTRSVRSAGGTVTTYNSPSSGRVGQKSEGPNSFMQMYYRSIISKRERSLSLLEYDPDAYFRKLAQPNVVVKEDETPSTPGNRLNDDPATWVKKHDEKPFTHSISATPSGAYNPWTGESLMKAGPGYVGTQDGTYYAPAGPKGVVNTKTGEFIPVTGK